MQSETVVVVNVKWQVELVNSRLVTGSDLIAIKASDGVLTEEAVKKVVKTIAESDGVIVKQLKYVKYDHEKIKICRLF